MATFDLLKAAAGASEQVDRAVEFIRGGPLTDLLEEMGDVHLESAIEHLRQANQSHDPERRLIQATGDLQNAFILFMRAARAGPSRKLRLLFDMANVSRSRAGATDCASAIGLIQWVIGESSANRRLWLDRAARQIALHTDEMRQCWDMGIFGEKYMSYGSHRTTLFHSFRQLEMNTLPVDLQRAGQLRFEDADQYRLASDRDTLNPDVVVARYFFTEELKRQWNDPLG
jgi:hypothetical protein